MNLFKGLMYLSYAFVLTICFMYVQHPKGGPQRCAGIENVKVKDKVVTVKGSKENNTELLYMVIFGQVYLIAAGIGYQGLALVYLRYKCNQRFTEFRDHKDLEHRELLDHILNHEKKSVFKEKPRRRFKSMIDYDASARTSDDNYVLMKE